MTQNFGGPDKRCCYLQTVSEDSSAKSTPGSHDSQNISTPIEGPTSSTALWHDHWITQRLFLLSKCMYHKHTVSPICKNHAEILMVCLARWLFRYLTPRDGAPTNILDCQIRVYVGEQCIKSLRLSKYTVKGLCRPALTPCKIQHLDKGDNCSTIDTVLIGSLLCERSKGNALVDSAAREQLCHTLRSCTFLAGKPPF